MDHRENNSMNNGTDEQLHGLIEMLPASVDLRDVLHHLERQLIIRALRIASGVQAEAARMLGISRSDMAYKLKKFNLTLEDSHEV